MALRLEWLFSCGSETGSFFVTDTLVIRRLLGVTEVHEGTRNQIPVGNP